MTFKKTLPVNDDGSPFEQKYSPGEFIISPSDSRGVSYRLTFRVNPDMEKGLDQIVASNRFPFNTRGDAIRWCVKQGLQALSNMEPVTSVSKRVQMLDGVLAEENAHSDFMHVFVALEESIGKYMADQAPDQAQRVIAMAKYNFEMMPDGYWRERYLKELTTKFSQFLGKGGVTLIVGNGGGPGGGGGND